MLFARPHDRGPAQQLIRDIDAAPTFSPDGSQIAYVRGILEPLSNRILVANADGSGERVLVERPTFGPGASTVSWSPDGRQISFTPDGMSDVTVMDADGSHVRQLTQNPGLQKCIRPPFQ